MHIRALSGDIDASGSFWGVSEGARIPYVTVKQRDFLVFRDFDDVVVFSRAGYVWHLRKQYKTKTNKNVVFFVFL